MIDSKGSHWFVAVLVVVCLVGWFFVLFLFKVDSSVSEQKL